MNRVLAPALAWWEGRTLRERRMLMAMAVLVLAVVAWLGVVRPLGAWRAEAARDRTRAEADLAVARHAAARLSPAEKANESIDLPAVVEAANQLTGLSPMTGMSPSGGFGFSLSNTPTAAAFGWLAVLRDQGVEASDLSVVENADATVSMEGTLAPAG